MAPRKRDDGTVDLTQRPLSYTQVDITERFGDDKHLGPDDWIETTPINLQMVRSPDDPDPQHWGLPAIGASDAEVYATASRLSSLREMIWRKTAGLPEEGVYCPICHIANTQIQRLHTPCPRCARPLLQFGWN